ncbi:hypothetical protein GN958_ATG19948 [Phytophthora infestans]|uniref:Uncharacterized protein n=1 Tax=Phytophthora infestans TaxID=4787 RepID=A0A8S9TSJ6_PHYIN|nr:hypothetical protein GN958_ATG19948 [Phytophthora infestans]
MFDADAIIKQFGEALDKYDRSQPYFIVGDIAGVNGSIGRKIKLPLIRSASHRLNLAVQCYIAQYDTEVEKVTVLMRYLGTKQKAVLRKIKWLMPVIKNPTRCLTSEEDWACAKHPSTTAKLVASPALEDGIVKVQSGFESNLTSSELRMLAIFEKPSVKQSPTRKTRLALLKLLYKRNKQCVNSKYVNLA